MYTEAAAAPGFLEWVGVEGQVRPDKVIGHNKSMNNHVRGIMYRYLQQSLFMRLH